MAQLSVFKPEQAIRIMKLIMGGRSTPGPRLMQPEAPLASVKAKPKGPKGKPVPSNLSKAEPSPRGAYDVDPKDLARQMAYEKERRITEAQIKDAQVLKGVQDPGANTATIMAGMTPGPDGRSVDEMLRQRAGIRDGMSYNEVLEALDRINPGNQGDANFAQQIALAHLFRDYAYPQFGSTSREVQSSSPSFDDFLEHERATLYSRKEMAEARRFAPLVTPSVDDPYYGKASGTSSRLSPTFGTVMKNTFSMMPHKQFDDDVRQDNKLGVLTPRGFKTALMMKMFGGPMMGLHPERLHLDNSLRTGGATTPEMVAEAMKEIQARFGAVGDARDIATHNVVGPKKFNQLWFPEAPMAANPNAALAGADAANGLMRADTIKFQGHNVNQRVLEAIDNLRSHARSPKLAGILSNLQDEFYKNPELAHTGFKPKPTAVSLAQVGPEYNKAREARAVQERQRKSRYSDQGSKRFKTIKDLVVLNRRPEDKRVKRTFEQQLLSREVETDGKPRLDVPKDQPFEDRRKFLPDVEDTKAIDFDPEAAEAVSKGPRAAPVGAPKKLQGWIIGKTVKSKTFDKYHGKETFEQDKFDEREDGKELIRSEMSPKALRNLQREAEAIREKLKTTNDPVLRRRLGYLETEFRARDNYRQTMTGSKGLTRKQEFSRWHNQQLGMGGERSRKRAISPSEAQLHDLRAKESKEPIGPDRERTPRAIYRKALKIAAAEGIDIDHPDFEEIVRAVAQKQVGSALKRDREFIDEKLKTTGFQNKRLAQVKNLPSRLVKRDVGAAIKDPESFLSRSLKVARKNAYKNTKSKNIAASTVRPRVQPPTGTPATLRDGPGPGQLSPVTRTWEKIPEREGIPLTVVKDGPRTGRKIKESKLPQVPEKPQPPSQFKDRKPGNRPSPDFNKTLKEMITNKVRFPSKFEVLSGKKPMTPLEIKAGKRSRTFNVLKGKRATKIPLIPVRP